MQAVFISPDSWHYKLQNFVYGEVPYRYHFCPYFWLTIAAIFFFPIIFSFRVLKKIGILIIEYVIEPIDNFIINKSSKKVGNIALIKNQAELFKYYHLYYKIGNDLRYFSYDNLPSNFYNYLDKNRNDFPFDLEKSFHKPVGKNGEKIEKGSEEYKLWREYKKMMHKDYYYNYHLPYEKQLKQEMLERERFEIERAKRRAKREKRKQVFSKIAEYTKYPIYTLFTSAVFVLAFFLTKVVIYGINYIASNVTGQEVASWILSFAILILTAVLLTFMFFTLFNSMIFDDCEFRRLPIVVRIFLWPFRLLGNLLSFLFDLIIATVSFIFHSFRNVFSIFIEFSKTMYEGACPNMIIDGII